MWYCCSSHINLPLYLKSRPREVQWIRHLKTNKCITWYKVVNILVIDGGWFGTLLCVVLALPTTGQSAKWCVVELCVANDARQIEELAYKPSDKATTRRLACFARDRMTRGQRDNAPFSTLSCCRYRQDEKANDIDALSLSTTQRAMYQISHHSYLMQNQHDVIQS
jgi:hypothetical protein